MTLRFSFAIELTKTELVARLSSEVISVTIETDDLELVSRQFTSTACFRRDL